MVTKATEEETINWHKEYDSFIARNKVYVEGTPSHYDNSKGSLYKFAQDHSLNPWEFDIVKRIVRSRKKGNFREDLEKTKVVIDLYLKESEDGRK